MRIPIQLIKFLIIFAMIFGFMATSAFFLLLYPGNTWDKKKRLTYNISWWSRLGLKVMGIKTTIHGVPPAPRNYLIVSNHQSYIDILVQSAYRPSSFVTSLDIKRMPLIGQICVLAGCLFVDRKTRQNLENEIGELTAGLKHGLDVTFFPEATSTDGSSVLRFKRPLFAASGYSYTPILPMALRYETIDDQPVDASNRDVMCWYGDMAFVPHLWILLGKRKVEATLTFLEPIEPSLGDIQVLSETAHQRVSSAYRPYL